MTANWKYAYVGIGSNLENPEQQVLKAMEVLNQQDKCRVRHRSSLYSTAPIGFEDQPDFVNAVCKLRTEMGHFELLELLLRIETELGRVRTGQINGPRSIDLDLLLYEGQTCHTEKLELPHPRMHERRFVLEPLLEIDSDIFIPGRGRGVDLLASCANQQVAKRNEVNENL